MNIFCVDADHHRLMELWRAAMVAAPNANVQKFDAIGDAVRYAMSVRCDVLLADLNTGGAAWTGIDVAKEIQKRISGRTSSFYPRNRLRQISSARKVLGSAAISSSPMTRSGWRKR